MENKFILDACCGSRMFWNNKRHPNTLYIDKRIREKGFVIKGDKREVLPDIQMDFRKLDFKDKTFKLVVFDPPHIIRNGEKGIYSKVFGILDKDTWKEDIKKGFEECWRVLEDYGTLIFKWSESNIKSKEVLDLFIEEPLIKHGGMNTTKWFCFMKIPETQKGEEKNGNPDHISAPRGSRTGTQGLKGNKERSVVPPLLCKTILEIIENK